MRSEYDVIRDDAVREIAIHVTQRCNLSCLNCYAHPSKDELAKELSIKDLEWIDRTFHPEKTVLLGGEPLLYTYLEKALEMFRNITISTNGYFVPKHINLLKEHDIKQLQISIEGRERYNNYIRGEGSYERAIQAGKVAKDNGINCYFRIGYCKQNLKDIKWLLENISTKMDIPLALLPRTDHPPLDIRDQIYLFDMITSEENGSLIAMPHFWAYLGKKGRCNAGSERLNFTYDKRITPCHMMWDYHLGYIGDPKDIIKIARETFIDACKQIKDSCFFCEHAEVCRGGCLVTPVHLGCPLKEHFSIRAYIGIHENVNVRALADKVNRLTDLVKEAEIC